MLEKSMHKRDVTTAKIPADRNYWKCSFLTACKIPMLAKAEGPFLKEAHFAPNTCTTSNELITSLQQLKEINPQVQMCKVLEQNTNNTSRSSSQERANLFLLCMAYIKITSQIPFCSFEAG